MDRAAPWAVMMFISKLSKFGVTTPPVAETETATRLVILLLVKVITDAGIAEMLFFIEVMSP
jgi:hypothetical protein